MIGVAHECDRCYFLHPISAIASASCKVAFDRCGILVAQFTTAIGNECFELGRGAANQMRAYTPRANARPHTVHAFRANVKMNMLIHSDRIIVSGRVSIFYVKK